MATGSSYSMASINPKGLSNFRRYLTQYQATYGSMPPSHLTSSYLQGEIDANLERADRNRQLRQQKEYQDQTINIQNRQMEANNLANDRNYAMQQRQYEDQQKAAKWSGIGQAVGLGLQAANTFDIGFDDIGDAADAIGDAAKSAIGWLFDVF